MRSVDQALASWRRSQCAQVDIAGLYARNRVAHKWKAPFRSISLRESVSWRAQDLLEQSVALYDLGHLLGARILLRSALETLAILIYLNQLTREVLGGKLDFHVYSDKTSTLLLGSRDKSTPHKSINIITILGRCETRYPGMADLYNLLSESAHPNYEGLAIGYSDIDPKNHVVRYSNRWSELYAKRHLEGVELCIKVFEHEYNEEWTDAFERLEEWIEAHSAQLEATNVDS